MHITKLEIFIDCQLLEEEEFSLVGKGQSIQDWTHFAETNTVEYCSCKLIGNGKTQVLFHPLPSPSFAKSSDGFDPVEFITNVGTESYKQVTWIAKELSLIHI